MTKNEKGWPRRSYREGSFGDYAYGLDLYVSLNGPFTDAHDSIVFKAMGELQKALLMETARQDPKNAEAKKTWLAEARKLFERAGVSPIHLKEIPNEYCGDACCLHRVWLLVTTTFGVLKVGWRKRVFVVDWSESDVLATAEDLFATEDTTKGEKMIHAWGYEKAEEYLRRIRESAMGG